MVRITGGQFRGHRLKVPASGVRPTKDMVREALFSSLGSSIEGKRVADLFAGSGVMGLEALSRGAAEVCWVEQNGRTFSVLVENVRSIAGEEAAKACVRSDVLSWLGSGLGPDGLDLLIADPPYAREQGGSWAEELLRRIADSARLKPEGLFVMEQRASDPVIDNPLWNRLKDKSYGDTRLVYYRRG